MTNRVRGQRVGLGKLIYSVELDGGAGEQSDDSGTPDDVIQEASEESFPASDPPGYATGVSEEVSIPPGSQAETEHPPHTEAWLPMTENDRPNRR